MKSLELPFGCLSGPDLIQSWELFSENKTDNLRIERCIRSLVILSVNSSIFAKGLAVSPWIPTDINIVRNTKP